MLKLLTPRFKNYQLHHRTKYYKYGYKEISRTTNGQSLINKFNRLLNTTQWANFWPPQV